MDLNLHPELKGPLKALCSDPNTTIVVLSGSSRSVLDKVCIYFLTLVSFLGTQVSLTDLVFTQNQNFGEYDMWLAAENGMFLRLTNGEWMTTMPEHLNMEWVDSVKVQRYLVQTKPHNNLSSVFFSTCSMFSSTSLREHQGHTLKHVILRLYGTTNMQVTSPSLYFWLCSVRVGYFGYRVAGFRIHLGFYQFCG